MRRTVADKSAASAAEILFRETDLLISSFSSFSIASPISLSLLF